MEGRSASNLFGPIITLILMVGTLSAAFTLRAIAQQPPSPTETPAATSAPPTTTQEPLEREVVGLRERINDISGRMDFAFTLFGIVIILGGGVSLIGFVRAESREKKAENRAEAIHAAFLDPSKVTLELVNATLQLAKEASEREKEASENAAQAIELKANEALTSLDRQAILLIRRVPEEDVHALASNPTLRSDLMKLARKIESFEINRLIFPTLARLTPHVAFIRGMEFYFNQNVEESLESWREAAVHKDSSNILKSIAWYWIGHEQNTIARFAEAEQSFRNARTNASTLMDLQFRRNIIESKFFNKEQTPPSDLIGPLEALLSEELLRKMRGEGGSEKVKPNKVEVRILATLGNVRIEAGNECRQPEEANKHYNKALKYFSEAESQDKWALFGKAEALYRLGMLDEAYPVYRSVRLLATRKIESRVEPRSRTAARIMYLICCIRVPDLWDEVPTARDNVIHELDEVGDDLTIYSEIKHRNIRKKDFRAELEQLMWEWEQYRTQAGGVQKVANGSAVEGDGT